LHLCSATKQGIFWRFNSNNNILPASCSISSSIFLCDCQIPSTYSINLKYPVRLSILSLILTRATKIGNWLQITDERLQYCLDKHAVQVIDNRNDSYKANTDNHEIRCLSGSYPRQRPAVPNPEAPCDKRIPQAHEAPSTNRSPDTGTTTGRATYLTMQPELSETLTSWAS
jgi:hypothetical protein